jgi:peptide deformylase
MVTCPTVDRVSPPRRFSRPAAPRYRAPVPVRPVLSIGHPTLRVRAYEINAVAIATAEVQSLIDDLIDTMRDANGAGIAANQIGATMRVTILEVKDNPRYPYKPEHDEIKRGLTAATWQHECDHLDGLLFVDRVKDMTTLSTWEQFELHHRKAFVERITAFVERVGS